MSIQPEPTPAETPEQRRDRRRETAYRHYQEAMAVAQRSFDLYRKTVDMADTAYDADIRHAQSEYEREIGDES